MVSTSLRLSNSPVADNGIIVLSLILVLAGCRSSVTQKTAVKLPGPGVGGTYDPPPVRTYPSPPVVIQGWIDQSKDLPKVVEH